MKAEGMLGAWAKIQSGSGVSPLGVAVETCCVQRREAAATLSKAVLRNAQLAVSLPRKGGARVDASGEELVAVVREGDWHGCLCVRFERVDLSIDLVSRC